MGFPAAWDSASVHTPYLDYSFKRVNGKEICEIRQNFKQPLKIVIRQNMGEGKYLDTAFSTEKVQHIELPVVKPEKEEKRTLECRERRPENRKKKNPDYRIKYRR